VAVEEESVRSAKIPIGALGYFGVLACSPKQGGSVLDSGSVYEDRT